MLIYNTIIRPAIHFDKGAALHRFLTLTESVPSGQWDTAKYRSLLPKVMEKPNSAAPCPPGRGITCVQQRVNQVRVARTPDRTDERALQCRCIGVQDCPPEGRPTSR